MTSLIQKQNNNKKPFAHNFTFVMASQDLIYGMESPLKLP